jgi:hypothetical protein
VPRPASLCFFGLCACCLLPVDGVRKATASIGRTPAMPFHDRHSFGCPIASEGGEGEQRGWNGMHVTASEIDWKTYWSCGPGSASTSNLR